MDSKIWCILVTTIIILHMIPISTIQTPIISIAAKVTAILETIRGGALFTLDVIISINQYETNITLDTVIFGNFKIITVGLIVLFKL